MKASEKNIVNNVECISDKVCNCRQLVRSVLRKLFRATASLARRLVWGRGGRRGQLLTTFHHGNRDATFLRSDWKRKSKLRKSATQQRYDRGMQEPSVQCQCRQKSDACSRVAGCLNNKKTVKTVSEKEENIYFSLEFTSNCAAKTKESSSTFPFPS